MFQLNDRRFAGHRAQARLLARELLALPNDISLATFHFNHQVSIQLIVLVQIN